MEKYAKISTRTIRKLMRLHLTVVFTAWDWIAQASAGSEK